VNLIGEHTDYNDGFVLPCALDFEAVVAWSLRSDGAIHVVAEGQGEEAVVFSANASLERGEPVTWVDYVKAMVSVWRVQVGPLPGMNLAIAGNVPQGSGLSSSAALEVALGTAFAHATGQQPGATAIALMAQRAENDFVGCRCGNMDQLISAHGQAGHALLIDCRSLDLTPVPLSSDMAVVVIDSRVPRGLVDSEYNLRRAQCEEVAAALGVKALRDATLEQLEDAAGRVSPVAFRRARHVISENARTVAATAALRAGDWVQLGGLMAASHASMRDDFEITVPPIDHIVAVVAEALGAAAEMRDWKVAGGVRMTGGGFGGCVVAMVPLNRVALVREALDRDYRAPSGEPARVYVCHAQAGAGVLSEGSVSAPLAAVQTQEV
jgi:galactokinase